MEEYLILEEGNGTYHLRNTNVREKKYFRKPKAQLRMVNPISQATLGTSHRTK